jgi:uncharacterized membrane protein HdeD (DUF308 family)
MANTRNLETPVLGIPAEEVERHFGLVVALGVVLLLVGALAISSNVIATLASVAFFGMLFAIAGITQIVLAFSTRGFFGIALHLMLGLLSLVSGVLLIRAPAMGAGALTLVIAAWLLASGLGQTLHAIVERHAHWGLSFVSGVVGALLGTLLLASFPESSLWFLGLYMGVQFVMQGITWLTLAFAVHRDVAHFHPAT